jgi:hypothetical protein
VFIKTVNLHALSLGLVMTARAGRAEFSGLFVADKTETLVLGSWWFLADHVSGAAVPENLLRS